MTINSEKSTVKLLLLRYIILLLLVLVSGVFWGTWFSLSRSMEEFSSAEFIHIGKIIIKNVAWPMRILMPTTILLMLINLWLHPIKKSWAFLLYVQSLILFVVTLLITVLILVPLDYQIKEWTVTSIPANWGSLRDRWQFYHTIRTFLCLGSFATFLYSTLFLTNKEG